MTRVLFIALFGAFCLVGCMNSRVPTHWIINNNSGNDVSLRLGVHSSRSDEHGTNQYLIRPGLQEINTKTFARGSYVVEVGDGNLRYSRPLRFENENWILINYINNDSLHLQHQYGMVDTANLKKVNGKYAGIEILNESRKPPFLYMSAMNKTK